MKLIIPLLFFTVSCLFCTPERTAENQAEPADPDTYDLSVWDNVKPGIHSGFGSPDVHYSKSIPPEGEMKKTVKLQGWKGERVHCKLIVWTKGNDEDITIKASGFRNGNSQIDQANTSVSVIRYVLADEFLNERGASCGPRDNDKVPAHLSPDLLSRENSFLLNARSSRPVWISVDIPPETPAGTYAGTISMKSASSTVTHSVTLEVLDHRLPPPSEWSFHLDLWQNPFAVARIHHVKLWSRQHLDLLEPLLKKLANAGQKCITTTIINEPWGGGPCYDPFHSMISWVKKKDGTWHYDYSIFDTYVSLAIKCGIKEQINCYSMVPINNKFSWFDEQKSDTVSLETTPGTKQYEDLWRGFLIDFRAHLKKKGWLDRTTMALDEREEEEMTHLFRFLKETAPEFKITMAGFYYKALNPSIYDFSSNWRHADSVAGRVLASRKASGLITTYYVACGIPKPNNFTFSPPAQSCYEGWYAAAKGYDGFLRWAANSWPENPMVDSRYIKWPSGDTYIIYPDGRSSVRFERLREGIQDFEKMKIIKEELARKDTKEAALALKKLNDFLGSIDTHTLDHKSAAEVINEGKQILYEAARTD